MSGAFVSSSSKPGIHVAWKTVTYRSVALAILFALILFCVGMNFAFPQFTQKGVKSVSSLGGRLLEIIAGAGGTTKTGTTNSQQAHITALDGTVRVKKASSNSWVTADYNVPLEKGDVVQTGAEGMAKIVFNDGTSRSRQYGHRGSIDRHLCPGIEIASDRGRGHGLPGPG